MADSTAEEEAMVLRKIAQLQENAPPLSAKHTSTKVGMHRMRKILESEASNDEKLQELEKLTSHILDENEKLSHELKSANLMRRHAESDLNKVTSAQEKKNGRLESLCRELQQHNKELIASQKQLTADECQKRADIGSQFGDQIKHIQIKMEEQNKERMKVHEENVELRTKLKNFLEQYEKTQTHWETQLKGTDLEKQLLQAKLDQANALQDQESQKSQIYEEKCTQLMQTELELRKQLEEYSTKFESFQGTIKQSTEMFTTFKSELTKLTKEKSALTKQCKEYEIETIKNLDERARHDRELEKALKKNDKLTILCRTLQEERAKLQHQVEIQNLPKAEPSEDAA